MRRREPAILEDDFADDFVVDEVDLGLTIDLARDDLASDDDDLGLRALYEDPDVLLGSSRRARAA
jgi:hypothetical protein